MYAAHTETKHFIKLRGFLVAVYFLVKLLKYEVITLYYLSIELKAAEPKAHLCFLLLQYRDV